MPKNTEEWKRQLDDILYERFGIGINDTHACDDEIARNAFSNGETPEEYAEYLKEKYDLYEL